jgi:dihydroorotate dehydrogenase (NAD+) catalytic subunit
LPNDKVSNTNSWIDLAPNHKLGLVVANPILLGAGAIGYGEAVPRGLDLTQVGAAVVGPVLSASRGGTQPPRLAHANGGIVLDTGLQNRGVNNAIQQYGKLWEKLGCPVIVQVVESHPATLAKIAGKLSQLSGVQGVELLPADPAGELDGARLATLVRTVDRACELPVWVKLPLAKATTLAPAACEAGAVGLVVGQPPTGTALRTANAATYPITGGMYGPFVFPQMLQVFLQIAGQHLPAALIACGGIHTLDQVQQALAAGAQAVQIDSAVWVEPGLPGRLAVAISNSVT